MSNLTHTKIEAKKMVTRWKNIEQINEEFFIWLKKMEKNEK